MKMWHINRNYRYVRKGPIYIKKHWFREWVGNEQAIIETLMTKVSGATWRHRATMNLRKHNFSERVRDEVQVIVDPYLQYMVWS